MADSDDGQVGSEARIGRVAGSTLIVMGGMAASLVVGLVRQRIIAQSFGTSSALDAFTAANGIPELLFTLLAGGALAFAYIPVYTEMLESKRPGEATLLASQVINTIFMLTALSAGLVALFAPVLVRAAWGVAPHFSPEVQSTTVDLMRILLLSTVIFSVSGIVTGTLHAHQHFLLPAITPVMYSGGIIFGALVFTPSMGVHGLAWGAVIGSALHLLVQVPGLIHFRVGWRPSLGWRSPALQRVAVLMAPRIVDLLMARIMIDWINSNIGSGLGEGRVAALRYAYQLMNMPWTLIGTAIGIAVFPTMAMLAAQHDLKAQRDALSGALRAVLTLALPAAVGLLVLGRPIIQVLFEGGSFTPESTELVFYALRFYALVLISQTMLEVVVRAFAAQQDTLTPLLVSFFTTALNVGLAIMLARPEAAGGLSHGGLPLANGIAVLLESLAGLTILQFRWGGIGARRLIIDTLKAATAAALMGAGIILLQTILQPRPIVLLGLGGVVGLAIYFGAALLLGIREVRSVPIAVLHRFVRRGQAATT